MLDVRMTSHPSGIPLAYQPSTHARVQCESTFEAGLGVVRCVKEHGHQYDRSRGGNGNLWHYSPRGSGLTW